MKKAIFKPLSFSTTMRNPARIAGFLSVLTPFENRNLTHKIIMQVVSRLIETKQYLPLYASRKYKDFLKNDEYFNQEAVEDIIAHSPQDHKEAGFEKGWDSRFDTWYRLSMEFGFCSYAMNEPLIITNTGHLLIDAINENNEAKIANIFLNCMMKYQSNNPFRRVLNANNPLLLLLKVMQILKDKIQDSKIHRSELSFFLCWKDDKAQDLANFILNFRKTYPSFEYSDEIVYNLCLKMLDSTNTKRFKMSQICAESIDEYIRKMRITGIVSLRGNGRFLDFNSFEKEKIDYILKNYTELKEFSSKAEYLAYMGQIDGQILELKETSDIEQKEKLKQKSLEKFAKFYDKEYIFKELQNLCFKQDSKDELLRFIPAPTRFEFLSAIALKQNLVDVEILPNYIIDDEGLPTRHASGNQADIICLDKQTKSIVELSLICGRAQLHNELIPITRHLKDMIKTSSSIQNFALFVAPVIFEDSKTYVNFIKFKENLDIINYDITNFVKKLQEVDDLAGLSLV